MVNYDNEKISIKAPLCSEESIYYSDINEIKYIDQFDFGKKVKGQFNKNYTAGWFNNTEYGDYYLISCNDVEDSKYLYIKSNDKVFIFNVKMAEVFSKTNTLLLLYNNTSERFYFIRNIFKGEPPVSSPLNYF